MCMLVVARRVHPRYPLIVVANRDEALDRPTEPLHEWSVGDAETRSRAHAVGDPETVGRAHAVRDPETVGRAHAMGDPETVGEAQPASIIAGRDVTAGGTWLALAAGARFAAVTNVREIGPVQPAPASRGALPVDALTGPVPVTEFAHHIVDDLDDYGPVNLLAGDLDEMWWASNRSSRGPLPLGTGVHGLSNAALDTPWPKVVGAVRDVRALMSTDAMSGPDWSATLLDLLADRRKALPPHLPHTGVPLLREWQLSSRFVRVGKWYGTRSTTAVRVDHHGTADVVERTWDSRGRITGTVSRRI